MIFLQSYIFSYKLYEIIEFIEIIEEKYSINSINPMYAYIIEKKM